MLRGKKKKEEDRVSYRGKVQGASEDKDATNEADKLLDEIGSTELLSRKIETPLGGETEGRVPHIITVGLRPGVVVRLTPDELSLLTDLQ